MREVCHIEGCKQPLLCYQEFQSCPAFISCLPKKGWKEMFSLSLQVCVGELLTVCLLGITVPTHCPLFNHEDKQNVIGKVALGSEGLWAEAAVKPCLTFDVDGEMSCGA